MRLNSQWPGTITNRKRENSFYSKIGVVGLFKCILSLEGQGFGEQLMESEVVFSWFANGEAVYPEMFQNPYASISEKYWKFH